MQSLHMLVGTVLFISGIDTARQITMWTFIVRVPHALLLVTSVTLAFNAPAQTNVVLIPRAPSAATLRVPIRPGWSAEFLCFHSDRELICAIAHLRRGQEERYPELLIDSQDRKTSSWQPGQWWLHSSYNLCEGNGEFDVYVRNGTPQCTKTKAGWRANHFPLSGDSAVMTIHVSLAKIGLVPGQQFGLAVVVTDTRSEWRVWPTGASRESPATWGTADLAEGPNTDH
jgi:hypothetical protein